MCVESKSPIEDCVNIEPIRTNADHKATLKEIAALMESDLGPPVIRSTER